MMLKVMVHVDPFSVFNAYYELSYSYSYSKVYIVWYISSWDVSHARVIPVSMVVPVSNQITIQHTHVPVQI